MAKVAQGRKQGPLEPCAQITGSEASALSNSLRCRRGNQGQRPGWLEVSRGAGG